MSFAIFSHVQFQKGSGENTFCQNSWVCLYLFTKQTEFLFFKIPFLPYCRVGLTGLLYQAPDTFGLAWLGSAGSMIHGTGSTFCSSVLGLGWPGESGQGQKQLLWWCGCRRQMPWFTLNQHQPTNQPEGDVMTSSGTEPCGAPLCWCCPSHGSGDTRGDDSVSERSPRSVLDGVITCTRHTR